MDKRKEAQEMNLAVQNAVTVLRNNIFMIRHAIVKDNPQLIVELLNEIEKTVSELEWKRIKTFNDPNAYLLSAVVKADQGISLKQVR
jgi:hypothetical protein